MTVTNADAVDDAAWFDVHPNREFHARQGDDGRVWLVRRYRGTFLRIAIAGTAPPDDDAAISPIWFNAAYPDLSLGHALRGHARRRDGRR